MTKNQTERKAMKFAALAATALMVFSVFTGGVMAAPGSIDSSTDAANDGEETIVDGKTMDAAFNASGDTTWNLTLQNVPDGADTAMNVSHNGKEYYSFSGAFSSYSDGDPDTTATTGGKYHAFSDAELNRVPMAINENVSLNVTYWNASATNPTPTTVTVYVENTDERSVAPITADSNYADVETVDVSSLKVWKSDYNATTLDDTRNVNGSNTTVIYTLEDSDVTDTFTNATEDYDSAGAFTLMQATTEGDNTETIPVFYRSAPDWYNVADHGSYGVYDSNDDTVAYHFSGENFDGQTNADMTLDTRSYGLMDAYTVYKLAGGYSNDGLTAVMDMAL